jgi:aspartyl-tRNA(Asn)/glutamyl-tRNA(Gln) amidotransferase subunit B
MLVKIGFEVHVQLNTKEKLFCRCSTEYDKENESICPICTGQPGSKPMAPNFEAIKNLIKIGFILGCKLNKKIPIFLRKHYFYPDLPKNFQITSEPIFVDGNFFGVRIREIHLEEDPGRYDLRNGYVDFNRSGIPLAEIVTEPDINSAEFAREWLEKLFLYLKYSKAIREEAGSIRADINISLENGERVEIKNVSSIHGVYRAIKYEILRQKRAIAIGKKIKRETRHYDEEKKITVSLREKETVQDYRYMPEPDLLPIIIDEKIVEEMKKELLIPSEEEKILREKFGLSNDYIKKIINKPEYILIAKKIFEKIGKDYKKIAELITNNLFKVLEENKLEIKDEFFEKFLEFYKNLENFDKNHLNEILVELINGSDYLKFAKEKGYLIERISEEEVEKIVEEVLKKEKKAVEDYKKGNEKALNYLIGSVFKHYGKRIDYNIVKKILLKKL